MLREGAAGSINPLEHDLVEMAEAVRNEHQHGCRPYATKGNIMRHDWDRRDNCIYTIDISGRRFRGPAEMLSQQMDGLRRASWEYWQTRPRVNPANIIAYLEAHGVFAYFRVIMWHHLPVERWLALWRIRRAARAARRS
jgi:hypothetical protein